MESSPSTLRQYALSWWHRFRTNPELLCRNQLRALEPWMYTRGRRDNIEDYGLGYRWRGRLRDKSGELINGS